METVKFTILKAGTSTIRIVPHDCRTKFKKIADGGCVCDVETMFAVMVDITRKCEEINVKALFDLTCTPD